MVLEFGPFTLDTHERVLRREGRPVPLTPKTFDILLVLVQNSGRVLTKQEIIERVWPDTIVDESNLARQVSTLRAQIRSIHQRNQTCDRNGRELRSRTQHARPRLAYRKMCNKAVATFRKASALA